jgi:hypothetical protein
MDFGNRHTRIKPQKKRPQPELSSRRDEPTDPLLSHPATKLLLLLVVLFILWIPLKSPVRSYDEGVAVYNAMRVMAGDVPYKEYWAIYPPGQTYVLAAVFATFGSSLLAARIYDTVVRMAIVISAYLLAKELSSFTWATIVALVSALLFGPFNIYGYALFPALALDLFALLALSAYSKKTKRHWLLVSGICLGLASLFRWDIALYATVASLVALFFFQHTPTLQSADLGKETNSRLPQELMVLIVAELAIVLAGYGYIVQRSGFQDFWEQAVIFPITDLRALRWRAYPSLIPNNLVVPNSIAALRSIYTDFMDWLRFYLALAIYAVTFAYYGYALLSRRAIFNAHYLRVTAVTLFGALLFTQALSRYDYFHVLPTSIIALLVIGTLPLTRMLGSLKLMPWLLTTGLLLMLGALYLSAPLLSLVSTWQQFSPLGCHSHLARATCVYVEPDQAEAIAYLQAATGEGEQIFVGSRRHDLILVNDVAFYFLANRNSATKYHELYPGIATTRPIQEQIVHELDSAAVMWVILVQSRLSTEDNLSAVSSQVTYLDDYIRSEYEQVAEFGNYSVWKKSINSD